MISEGTSPPMTSRSSIMSPSSVTSPSLTPVAWEISRWAMAAAGCMRSQRAIRELFGANALDGLPRFGNWFGRPSTMIRMPGATMCALPLKSSHDTPARSQASFPDGPMKGTATSGMARLRRALAAVATRSARAATGPADAAAVSSTAKVLPTAVTMASTPPKALTRTWTSLSGTASRTAMTS
jgi:hypothetical protein